MSAIRLARGFTGRSKVVKFAGCYHGHVDSLLAAAGSGVATLGLPDTPGVTGCLGRGHRRPAVQRPGRRRGRLRDVRRGHRRGHHRGGRRQHGRRPAGAGLQRRARRAVPGQRRALRQRRGDDRLPGLARRLVRARGRAAGPDDLRQGDGRRLPGRGLRRPRRRDGRGWRRPGRSTRRGRCRGTRSRPPPGSRPCGGATTSVYARVDKVAAELAALASEALSAAGVAHRLQHAGSMFSVFFSDASRPGSRSPTTRARAQQDVFRFAAFFHAMLDARGLPAAVGLRVLVPVRRPRRRRRLAGRRRPARRRPRRRPGQPTGGLPVTEPTEPASGRSRRPR